MQHTKMHSHSLAMVDPFYCSFPGPPSQGCGGSMLAWWLGWFVHSMDWCRASGVALYGIMYVGGRFGRILMILTLSSLVRFPGVWQLKVCHVGPGLGAGVEIGRHSCR